MGYSESGGDCVGYSESSGDCVGYSESSGDCVCKNIESSVDCVGYISQWRLFRDIVSPVAVCGMLVIRGRVVFGF